MTSAFNPAEFLEMSIEEANDTKHPVITPGPYPAQITKIDVRINVPSKKDPATAYSWLDITWNHTSQELLDHHDREVLTTRQSISLDMTTGGDGTPRIATGAGKNIGLGQLRETVGLNVPGFSLVQLIGKEATIHVKHRDNPDDPDSPFAEIKKVSAL